MTTRHELFSLNLPKRLVGETRYGGANSERPALIYEVALRNLGRAERLTARRSTPARSATTTNWNDFRGAATEAEAVIVCLSVVGGHMTIGDKFSTVNWLLSV